MTFLYALLFLFLGCHAAISTQSVPDPAPQLEVEVSFEPLEQPKETMEMPTIVFESNENTRDHGEKAEKTVEFCLSKVEKTLFIRIKRDC